MVNLNLVKPITVAQKQMALKCHWSNMNDIPVRKNILPEEFVSKAESEPDILTISTKLNPNNYTVMEFIMGNNKLSNNYFVRKNLSEILNVSKTEKGAELVKSILTSENINKLEYQKMRIQRHPKDYIKDKTLAKYLSSPAGISSLYSDFSILKAAEILDKEALDKLFKMDVTEGLGKNLLDKIGELDLEQLSKVKTMIVEDKSSRTFENIVFSAIAKSKHI